MHQDVLGHQDIMLSTIRHYWNRMLINRTQAKSSSVIHMLVLQCHMYEISYFTYTPAMLVLRYLFVLQFQQQLFRPYATNHDTVPPLNRFKFMQQFMQQSIQTHAFNRTHSRRKYLLSRICGCVKTLELLSWMDGISHDTNQFIITLNDVGNRQVKFTHTWWWAYLHCTDSITRSQRAPWPFATRSSVQGSERNSGL